MESTSTWIIFMFDSTSSSNVFAVITILTHTPLIHHTIHIFADKTAKRNDWNFAETSVAATLASTDFVARAAQSIGYSFHSGPFPALNFCIEEVSNKLVVVLSSPSFIRQFLKSFTAEHLAQFKIFTQGKIMFPLLSLAWDGTLETTNVLTNQLCISLIVH